MQFDYHAFRRLSLFIMVPYGRIATISIAPLAAPNMARCGLCQTDPISLPNWLNWRHSFTSPIGWIQKVTGSNN
jgi:hypothetical protein